MTHDSKLFVSILPAGMRDRRYALALALASSAIFLVLIPYAKLQLASVQAFVPIYETGLVVTDAITAVLLLGQFSILGSRRLLILAVGYLFTACIAVVHALTFPGLFSPSGLLGAGPQSTAWIYMFWHAGYPAFVLAYALRQDTSCPPSARPGVMLSWFGGIVAAVAAVGLLTTAGKTLLPSIMTGNSYTPAMIGVVLTVWLMSCAALVALWRKRPHSVLDMWLMAVMCVWLCDIALSAVFNGGRFDLGFYAGRIYGLLAASLLLVILLIETNMLYARLAEARRLSTLHEAILGTVADGILGIDGSGTILFTNPSAERMLFSRPGALDGLQIGELLLQADPLAGWRNHPLALPNDGSTALNRECDVLQRPDGASFPVAYTASPLDITGSGRFGWVMVFQDITDRKKSEEELILTARYDTLTGLPNRRMFQDYLVKALSRAERSSRHLAVLFLDLDGFKAVNDTLGHYSGDLLLKQVGQRLAQSIRAGDMVSRLGGDEFTLIVEDSTPEQIAGFARKIVKVLDDPYELHGKTALVSASIGIALYPECGNDPHTLLQKADRAMYEVKKAGKKGYKFGCQPGGDAKSCGLFPLSQASIGERRGVRAEADRVGEDHG